MMQYGLGRVPSPPDPRDHPLSFYAPVLPYLPPVVRTKRGVPVLNQGQTPQCVAYSGALQRFIGELPDEHDRALRFDAPELYARCKERDGDPTGAGTFIRVACKVLAERGAIVSASGDPAEVGKLRPIAAYARLSSLRDIKAAILLFGSAWVGSDWPYNWEDVTGTLPPPGAIAGGHAYSFTGYSDHRAAFRMQNNWGPDWAFGGRAWLPYDYVRFDGGLGFEAWRCIDLAGDVQ